MDRFQEDTLEDTNFKIYDLTVAFLLLLCKSNILFTLVVEKSSSEEYKTFKCIEIDSKRNETVVAKSESKKYILT